jgi:hypothetical protein
MNEEWDAARYAREKINVIFKATLVISVCSKQGAFRVRP